jgi:hypothetical protein
MNTTPTESERSSSPTASQEDLNLENGSQGGSSVQRLVRLCSNITISDKAYGDFMFCAFLIMFILCWW